VSERDLLFIVMKCASCKKWHVEDLSELLESPVDTSAGAEMNGGGE